MTPDQFTYALLMHGFQLRLLRWEIARLEAKRVPLEKML
jgi:hypothetical protein